MALPGRCWQGFGQLQPLAPSGPAPARGPQTRAHGARVGGRTPSQSQGLNSKHGSQFLQRPRVLETRAQLELWTVSFPGDTAATPAQPPARGFKWSGLQVTGVLYRLPGGETEWRGLCLTESRPDTVI